MQDVTVPLSILISSGGIVAAVAGAIFVSKVQIAHLEASHAKQSADTRADLILLRLDMNKGIEDVRNDTVSRREYDARDAALAMQFKMITDGLARIERRMDSSQEHS